MAEEIKKEGLQFNVQGSQRKLLHSNATLLVKEKNKYVDTFRYLGCKVTPDEKKDTEIKRMNVLSKNTFNNMAENCIFASSKMSLLRKSWL